MEYEWPRCLALFLPFASRFYKLLLTKGQDFTVGEDGLFPNLPFTEHTMKDQDENEDIFEALEIAMDEKPYFIYIAFYICLAIIKKNIYDATKDEKQKELFIKYCSYIKNHFDNYMKAGLQMDPDDTPRFTPEIIPARYGLKPGHFPIFAIQSFAGDFLNNFIDDLNTHLKRTPGMREALVKYL